VALETAPELAAYNNAVAKTWLSAVTDDASLATQIASLDAIVAAIVTGTETETEVNPGQAYSLTTGEDNLVGTAGNDTFNATYDGGIATDTLSAADIIDGLGGSDTLKIDHLMDVAITPPDTLWTGIRNIEKVVINTTGDGAQTLTTGVNFEAAFAAGGVTLTTTTSGAGAITLNLSTFTGEAVLNTTSLAGAQTIVTGSGLTAVTASSDAGALVIKGTGLGLVSATTTGSGAQTIGDADGNGANLTMVNATAHSGTQTITSTNTANTAVTATSTSGLQHIITGAGNDTVTTTAAAGTINTISTGAGNDTIVASLGNDLITGGLGADTMTGGGGVDTFAFGSDGSIIGASMDVITDFNVGGADILTFGAATTVLAVDATALVAGSNVQTSAGGLISFHANDNTLALKISAVQADSELDVAGSVAMFVDGGNTYVYYAGAAAGNDDDQLIQLSGITTLETLTGGSTTTIA
jgi:Ca2+-binding RTX toxin-like protein